MAEHSTKQPKFNAIFCVGEISNIIHVFLSPSVCLPVSFMSSVCVCVFVYLSGFSALFIVYTISHKTHLYYGILQIDQLSSSLNGVHFCVLLPPPPNWASSTLNGEHKGRTTPPKFTPKFSLLISHRDEEPNIYLKSLKKISEYCFFFHFQQFLQHT